MAPSFDDPQPPVWEPEPLELPVDAPVRPDPTDEGAGPSTPRSERRVIVLDDDEPEEPESRPGVIVVDLC